MRTRVPILKQLERQNDATRALLPFVAALPQIDINNEVLVRAFGQSMALRNFIASINYQWPFPEILDIPMCHPKTPRTQEEKRTYWRIMQRQHRERKRNR